MDVLSYDSFYFTPPQATKAMLYDHEFSPYVFVSTTQDLPYISDLRKLLKPHWSQCHILIRWRKTKTASGDKTYKIVLEFKRRIDAVQFYMNPVLECRYEKNWVLGICYFTVDISFRLSVVEDNVKPKLKPRTLYDVLGTTRYATTEDLKKRYRMLALKTHPDRNDKDNATTEMMLINNAWDVLSTPTMRKSYDLSL